MHSILINFAIHVSGYRAIRLSGTRVANLYTYLDRIALRF